MLRRSAEHPVRQSNAHGAVTPPVVRSSTFTYPTSREGAARFQGAPGHVYSRLGNPTVRALEEHVATLEGGEDAVVTASGMGAIHVALMSLLTPGSRVVTDPCVYGCTASLLKRLERWGVEVVRAETSDRHALEAALADGVDVLYVETPMNPNLRLVDLEHAAHTAHDAGGLLVVDNTFATPAAQRPLDHGADLALHSLTKAVNGHSDLLGGAIVGVSELIDECRGWLRDAGPIMDPEVAWLCLRGAQTLDLRLERMNANALRLAKRLHQAGFKASHPLLPHHPDHALAKRQMPRGCGLFTLDLDTEDAAMAFMDRLRVFQRAVSLGGVESLVSHPASTTHAIVDPEVREAAGITPGLVRVSVGVEPYDALLADVEQALEISRPETRTLRV